jgi:recombination protein RecA
MARKRKGAEEAPHSKGRRASEMDETLAAVTKNYGVNTIQKGSQIYQPNRISTGSFIMDFALMGGIPEGRCSMLVGEKHSGKSMMASRIIGSAQRMYPEQKVVLLDVEGTFDEVWAGKLGVDTEELYVVSPDTGEQCVDIGDAMMGTWETSLLVVDSIAALTPMKEIDSSAEDAHVGIQARLMGNFIRKIGASLIRERKRNHCITVLFINQFRSKIGGFAGFGEPRSIPGGKAVEFVNSVQIIMKNKENKGKDENQIDTVTHNEHPFTITKNKCNQGPRTGEFVLIREDDPNNNLYAGDIDDAATVLSYAKKFGVYTGGGTKWSVELANGDNYRFGKAAEAISALREDRELYWALRTQLIQMQATRLGMPADFIERLGEQC